MVIRNGEKAVGGRVAVIAFGQQEPLRWELWHGVHSDAERNPTAVVGKCGSVGGWRSVA